MNIDTNSAEYIAIKRIALDEIERLRTDLEDDQPQELTAKTRGSIAALRWLIRKAEQVPDKPIPTVDYLKY